MSPGDPDLLNITLGSVSAPAGCGKTQLICDAIGRHDGAKPILVLTHTNAGVAALRARLDRAGVSDRAYRLSTIDGWAMRLIGMFPTRSGHDAEVLRLERPAHDYPAIRDGTVRLLKSEHLSEVILATYSRVIVDEFQDCSTVQHSIVQQLSTVLPTVVLGDPLQAIFGFGANVLVDWAADVAVAFPPAGELATPHRWINAGQEKFGRWLLEVRGTLLAGKSVDIGSAPQNVSWVQLVGKDVHRQKLAAGMAKSPTPNGKVILIATSKDRDGQRRRLYASQLPGAVTAENVDMSDVVSFASALDLQADDALKVVLDLAGKVMTNVGVPDFLARVATIRAGSERKGASDAEKVAVDFVEAPSFPGAAALLEAVAATGGVRVHRPAILAGCFTLLRSCAAGTSPKEAAVSVRERSRLIGRPLAKRTVGSTLLLKGLEAEVAVILDVEDMDAKHLYVAMTRGSHSLVVCSSSRFLP